MVRRVVAKLFIEILQVWSEMLVDRKFFSVNIHSYPVQQRAI